MSSIEVIDDDEHHEEEDDDDDDGAPEQGDEEEEEEEEDDEEGDEEDDDEDQDSEDTDEMSFGSWLFQRVVNSKVGQLTSRTSSATKRLSWYLYSKGAVATWVVATSALVLLGPILYTVESERAQFDMAYFQDMAMRQKK